MKSNFCFTTLDSDDILGGLVLKEPTESSRLALQNGHEIMGLVRANLARMTEFEYTYQQVLIRELVLATVCPFLYGDAYAVHKQEIKIYNGFPALHTATNVYLERAMGMTQVLCDVATVLLLYAPGLQITFLAAGSGDQDNPLNKIYTCLRKWFIPPYDKNKVPQEYPLIVKKDDCRLSILAPDRREIWYVEAPCTGESEEMAAPSGLEFVVYPHVSWSPSYGCETIIRYRTVKNGL